MAAESTDEALKAYKRAVISVIQSQYAVLSSVLHETNMDRFVKEAFAVDLISEPVMRSKNYDEIISEFTTGLRLKGSVVEVKRDCNHLIRILKDLCGAPASAGRNLDVKLSHLDSMLSGEIHLLLQMSKIMSKFLSVG